MKILQICPKCPYPSTDGGSLAVDAVTRGLLQEGHSVKMLAIDTPKHPASGIKNDTALSRRLGFESRHIDTGPTPLSAFFGLFSQGSYNVNRFYSTEFEQLIVDTLRRDAFDVVHLESLYVAPYVRAIRRATRAPIVYRAHNIEHRIWQATRDAMLAPVKRSYLSVLTEQLRRYEIAALARFDAVAAITQADATVLRDLGCTAPIEVIPFGIDPTRFPQDPPPPDASCFHLGAMDWLPNQEAIRFLLDSIWPMVRTAHPEAELHLAGRATPAWLQGLFQPGVTVHGEVSSASEFMGAHGIMVVPLLSGSGMRIKIIEGLAMGRAVVSTSLGAAGVEGRHGQDLWIADTAQDLARALSELLSNEPLRLSMGQAARSLVAGSYDNRRIARRLASFYERLIAARR